VNIGNVREERYGNGTIKRCRHYNAQGRLHREDGPAEEGFCKNGTLRYRMWCRQGKDHREDGPALETFRKDGSAETVFYYLDDEKISQEEHRRRMALRKLVTTATGRPGVSL